MRVIGRKGLILEVEPAERLPNPHACAHALFEEQVARDPDAIAVVFGDQELTYRALNARANQVAHFLRGQGVGPDTLVGVCLARTPALVVALPLVLFDCTPGMRKAKSVARRWSGWP